MRDFKQSIEKRTGVGTGTQTNSAGSGRDFQTPIITVIVTVAEDIDLNEAQLVEGTLNSAFASPSFVSKVNQDYTVNSFGAETVTALRMNDIEHVEDKMTDLLRDEGYTIEGVSVQAEITTSAL